MVHIAIGNGTSRRGKRGPILVRELEPGTGPVNVVTYNNCETVDLYVNSTKIGTRNSSDSAKNGIMQWTNVPWEAGVIKAVGFKNGKEAATDSIKTAGAPAKIVLKPDHTRLYADGNDASSIEVADSEDRGRQDHPPHRHQHRSVGDNWPGKKSRYCQRRLASPPNPSKPPAGKPTRGRALIVIQATRIPGKINLTISSPGLTPARLTLTSQTQ